MPLPDSSTIYYLRNSYTQQYLSLSGSGPAVAPAAKNGSLGQQWKFFPDGKGGFYLQNLANLSYFALVTYYSSYGGWYTVSTSSGTTYAWFVSEISTGIFAIGYGGYYYMHDEGGIYAVTSGYTYTTNEAARNQWYLEPYPNPPNPPPPPMINKNPLPKGIYRIRSFNGTYLLTMPQDANASEGNKSPYVSKQIPKNDAQKWLVTPQANGLYTISNSGNGLYLAAFPSNLVEGAPLIGQSTATGDPAFQWNIQTFGPGVMFFIGLQAANLSIGFSDYEAEDLSVVALETSDNIPSQIWFFETFKALASATFHAKRLLDPGTYTIELLHDNHYLKISDDRLASVSKRSDASQFIVAFADNNTPNFILSYKDSEGTLYVYADQDRIKTSEDRKTTWVLLGLEHDDNNGIAYHICDSTSADPRKAISSRMITDRSKFYFALDPLAEQEVMQLWRFHPV